MATIWNYDRYAALDDGQRYQVFSGSLVREPAPTTWHQSVVQTLHLRLAPHVFEIGGKLYLAPVDVVLDAGAAEVEVLQPDLLWIRKERVWSIVEARRVSGPPDLVVEVLSPSNRRRDIEEKVSRYRRFNVESIWLVDPPRRTLVEFSRSARDYDARNFSGDEIFRPSIFPDWRLQLQEIWVEVPEG